jgi:hypothetical protein
MCLTCSTIQRHQLPYPVSTDAMFADMRRYRHGTTPYRRRTTTNTPIIYLFSGDWSLRRRTLRQPVR